MMHATGRKKQRGLTLVELLGTISIIAVVNSLAGPTLGETVKRNQLRSQAERVMTTLNLARSEAVKRNQPVSVCRSEDGETCSGGWSDGWIVFSNLDGDNAVDVGTDEVIRVYDGLAEDHQFYGTVGDDAMTYFSDGSYAAVSETVRICPKDGDLAQSWTVEINTVGRPRVTKGVSECS
jgi:type IV fimbrial biogenesis protein FimT